MRAFVALPLPPAVQAALWRSLGSLRAATRGVRWVEPELMHLTLLFFGTIGPERADLAVARLADPSLRRGPLAARLAGLGGFPGRGSPRVLFASLAEGGAECGEYRERLKARLDDVVRSDDRPFAPHLTIGRAKERLRGLELDSFPIDSGVFTIDRCALYESLLGGGGPRYREVASVEFRDR